jgi:hypothetical protein
VTDSGMADLISRAAAIARIDKCVALSGIGLEPVMAVTDIKALISVLPAVSAVPVVRCQDCMYWKSNMLTHFWKPCDEVKTDKDWYCPCGRR